MTRKKIALISVFDKNGITEFVRQLKELAAKAEYIVSRYCLLSARVHSAGKYNGFWGEKSAPCKYGENAYQSPAALYANRHDDPLSLDQFALVAGTALSYNNYCDLDRLLQIMTHIAATFDVNRRAVPRIAIGVKHGNACGAAESTDAAIAVKKMVTGDPQALFGGLVMINFPVDATIAELLLSYASEGRRLLDGIIAPEFSLEAIDILKRKGDKCRFVANQKLADVNRHSLDRAALWRYVRGGCLIQENYSYILDLADPDLKKYGELSVAEEDDMLLAKAIGDTSNSNTITIVRDGQLLANGVGQQSRVNGAKLAIRLGIDNGHHLDGSIASSDSFFPFLDGPAKLAEAGIKAIVATSGSIRDKEVIDFCVRNQVVLYLIPDTKGRGFFNH